MSLQGTRSVHFNCKRRTCHDSTKVSHRNWPASIGPRMAVVIGGSAETETIHDLLPHVERCAENLICETGAIHELVPHVERYAANLICSIYCNGAFSCILTRFNVRPVLSAQSRHCAIHCQYGAPSPSCSCWASLTAECVHTSSCRLSMQYRTMINIAS